MSLPIPPLPGTYYTYEGTVPDVEALLDNKAKTLHIVSLLLTNITSADVEVTLKSNEASPATEAVLIISANDQVPFTYQAGWKFKSGFRSVADTASAIRIQIKGYREV
jgi:hypothetical protein